MKKVGIVFGLIIIFFFIFIQKTIAEDGVASPTSAPQTINSFELFWPVVAGKTEGDSLYFLKIIKEKIKGKLIFGHSKKADYAVSLATKRVVETEKLLQKNENRLALDTLDKAINRLGYGQANWIKSKQLAGGNVSERVNLENQLNNLDVFLTYLSSKYEGEINGKLLQTLDKVKEFTKEL